MSETPKYAQILDKGECMSSIIGDNRFNWKNETIKQLAGKAEWVKHDFYPANGMIGEIVDTFDNNLWNFKVYVLFIDNKFYVPMSPKGIKFITREEMLNLQGKVEKSIPQPVVDFNRTHNQASFILDAMDGPPPTLEELKKECIEAGLVHSESAKRILTQRRLHNVEFQNYLNEYIENIKHDEFSQWASFNELIGLIAFSASEDIKREEYEWDNYHAIARYIGEMCYAHKCSNIISLHNYTFEYMFLQAWEEYFEEHFRKL